MTLVADAGVGKSRLTAEFLERISQRAFIVSGRCLAYGEGITFWPLAEALKNAAGIVNDDGADEALEKLLAASQIGASVACLFARASHLR